MDDFKKAQIKQVGPGGFDCPCCNDKSRTKGKKEKSFNKKARQECKRQGQDEIDSVELVDGHYVDKLEEM